MVAKVVARVAKAVAKVIQNKADIDFVCMMTGIQIVYLLFNFILPVYTGSIFKEIIFIKNYRLQNSNVVL